MLPSEAGVGNGANMHSQAAGARNRSARSHACRMIACLPEQGSVAQETGA